MLKIIYKVILLSIILKSSLLASELTIEDNFNAAIKKAKTQNKKVMMMYSAVWCPECEYMKDIVLKDKEVSKYIKNKYIVVILDIKKDKLLSKFNYIGIPTFFFIDKNGKEINKIVGGNKASKFLKQLKSLQCNNQ
jgi:thiol:disulfide interchange protein